MTGGVRNGSRVPTAGGSAVLLTIAEVAEQLQICRETARRLCMRGEIAYSRVGNSIRVEAEEIEDFVSRTRRS